MKEQEIYNHQLAIRYFEGRITPSEEEILFRFVNDAPSNERMFRQWEDIGGKTKSTTSYLMGETA